MEGQVLYFVPTCVRKDGAQRSARPATVSLWMRSIRGFEGFWKKPVAFRGEPSPW